MSKLKSEGKCCFCNKTFSKQGFSKHLKNHLQDLPLVDRKKSFHLSITAGPYFLHLLIDGDCRLEKLDRFLKQIWLECCGHMSQFGHGRWDGEIKKSTIARRVFEKGTKLWYAYDFGSTTELDIKCIDVYPIATKEDIRLLTRNEPLKMLCDVCEKPASTFCTNHWYEEDDTFCDACAEKHAQECDEAEYTMQSIINSPRMGVCGYSGGSIDLERDGVFQK